MHGKFLFSIVFLIVTAALVASIAPQNLHRVDETKARAAEAWRITREYHGRHPDRLEWLKHAHWLIPEELRELGRIEEEMGKGAPSRAGSRITGRLQPAPSASPTPPTRSSPRCRRTRPPRRTTPRAPTWLTTMRSRPSPTTAPPGVGVGRHRRRLRIARGAGAGGAGPAGPGDRHRGPGGADLRQLHRPQRLRVPHRHD